MDPRCVLALVLAAAALLAAPAAAGAGTLSRDGTVLVFTEEDAHFTANQLKLGLTTSGQHVIYEGIRAIANDNSGCDDDKSSGIYWYCAGMTGIRIRLGGGSDTLTATGADPALSPAAVPITVSGGPGADVMTGGDANDVMDGDGGADTMNGGLGFDFVSYASHSAPVTVDLADASATDGGTDDSLSGPRDSINTTDIEGVIGGSGGDTLRGRPGPDHLDGAGGADNLDALGGGDTLLGGPGFDTIEARDGEVDSVDCGPDDDSAFTDPVDARANCDPAPPADGATGGETGGNVGETTAPTGLARVLVDVGFGYSAGRRWTRLRRLFVRNVPAGSALSAKCRTRGGRRCRKTRDLTRRGVGGDVRLRSFEARRLPVGARLTIRVMHIGMIGAVERLTIRRGRAPRQTTLCLPPGARTGSRC